VNNVARRRRATTRRGFTPDVGLVAGRVVHNWLELFRVTRSTELLSGVNDPTKITEFITGEIVMTSVNFTVGGRHEKKTTDIG
jgi:hypothetical protein